MKISSPLRYPGGKSVMTGLISQIRQINGLGSKSIAEPFAGGAGASLKLLYLEDTYKILINDADPAIFSFWWTLANRHKPFLKMLSHSPVSINEWRRQRNVYRSSKHTSRLRLGFAAFYLNRCNRSGIIANGGPIGGIEQAGKWKINARFNKPELIQRCEKVAKYRNRIKISGYDGIDFIKQQDLNSTFFFIDPPYFGKGPMLYLDGLDSGYHSKLAKQLKKMADAAWILTYDDCPEIRRLYRGWATIRPFSLCYAAAKKRKGKEILISPKWMKLPKHQESAAIVW